MFIGHYGPAIAAADRGKVRLWHGFVAVQFLDILWAPFVLAGIEHVRIVEGFTEANALDLYHMPYTHSLVAALLWSAVAGGLFQLWRKGGGVVIGLLVMSHWMLDFVVHKPDLPLWPGGPKVGLGLWDNLPVSLSTEILLVLAGAAFYATRTAPKNNAGRIAALALLAALGAAQLVANLGPPPADANEAALTAIVAYAVFIVLAAVTDATRRRA